MPLAPLRSAVDLRLTPAQFERVCAANPEAVPELTARGQLITITPTGSEPGAGNSALLFQLKRFAGTSRCWKVFASSSGFHLPDGSVLSPTHPWCGSVSGRSSGGVSALLQTMAA
ncbi:MAG: hypothetical protein AAFX65_06025 [Cyanobacteria bacterium J06638_7]